jgi:hypothetical protein
VRALLDCGAIVGLLNKTWAKENNIPTFQRP